MYKRISNLLDDGFIKLRLFTVYLKLYLLFNSLLKSLIILGNLFSPLPIGSILVFHNLNLKIGRNKRSYRYDLVSSSKKPSPSYRSSTSTLIFISLFLARTSSPIQFIRWSSLYINANSLLNGNFFAGAAALASSESSELLPLCIAAGFAAGTSLS